MWRRLWQRLRPCVPVHTLRSTDAYDLWSASYPAEAHNVLMQLEQKAMSALMPHLQGQVVLDLACGTGRYGQMAQRSGAKRVVGLDNSEAMLRGAVIDAVAQASVSLLPLKSSSIDVVLCGLALGHCEDLNVPLNEIARVLKPHGIALISDFHPFQALQGHQRTFQAPDGRIYAVEHYVHLYADYHHTAQSAGLQIAAVREPLYEQEPVALILKFEKVR